MVQFTVDEAINIAGYLETIADEARELPQVGGNEATILEQAEAALEIVRRELSRCVPRDADAKHAQDDFDGGRLS